MAEQTPTTGIAAGSAGNVAGHDVHNYQDPTQPVMQQGERFEQARQLGRLEDRLAALADELYQVRQNLAVTGETINGIREKVEALQVAVLSVQQELRGLTDKISAPPKNLSSGALITVIVLAMIVIVVLVTMTGFLLLRVG